MRDIIIDGKIIYNNLKHTNNDEQWVREELKTHNISNVEEVFYAGLNAAEILYISKKLSHLTLWKVRQY